MKNILALIGLAVVLTVGLGWYQGWYKIGTTPGADGHRQINVDVNTKKITEDEKKLQQKVTDVISSQTQSQGNGIVPNVPTAQTEKKVEAQTTGFQFNPDGSVTIVPQFKNIGSGN
jgi:hypothetical protein